MYILHIHISKVVYANAFLFKNFNITETTYTAVDINFHFICMEPEFRDPIHADTLRRQYRQV
jgi:hypothetical protein